MLACLVLLVTAAPAHAAPGWTALVANDQANSVTPVDSSSGAPGANVGVGSLPLGIAVAPDARTAYVVNLGATSGTGSLTPIDLTGSRPVARAAIALGGGTPNFIAIAPDGRKAYVSNPGNGTIVPLDLRTTPTTVGTPFSAGTGVEGIAFTPDGTKAYAADLRGNVVIPITVATNSPRTPIPLPPNDGPFAVALTPDGRTAYVTELTGGTVTPIDVATDTALPDIAVGPSPQGIAVAPDGNTVYAAVGGSGTVVPITVATNTAGPGIAVGNNPYAIAVAPDGRRAYVTNGGAGDNTIVPLDLTTAPPTAGGPIQVGTTPRGIAITPDQGPIADLTVASGPAGRPSTLDASTSTVSFGAIAHYAWSFGDGTPDETTTTPETSHVYSATGSYSTTVTATTAAGTAATGEVFTGQTASRVGRATAITRRVVVITEVPSPALGARVNAETVAGVVLVRPPGQKRFVVLGDGRQLRVGTVVDARKGTVRITATSGDKAYSAVFYEGEFVIGQRKRTGATADMRLFGGNFRRCPPGLRSPRSLDSKRPQSLRHLWGNGRGPFRTVGRFSSATVRGTTWLTDDQCTGTLTRVSAGSVTVRDFVRRRNVIVRRGKSYFAAARR